jgi:hypothetical protein
MVVAFGNLFNEIKMSRYDANGVELENFLVPIVYGGKEKYVSRLEGDPNLDKKVQVSLPIISFEMINMSYDASRKLNTNLKTISPLAATKSLTAYNPVPFDFDFSLFVYVRNIEDGAQIMEKILPYFTPDRTLSVNLLPEMGVIKQIPIVLKDVQQNVDYEGDHDSKVRTVIWTLNFTLKGYLYGPTTESKIIKTAITNIFDDVSLSNKNLEITLQSGGLGNYTIGSTVYQGYSYDTNTATAKVVDWNPATNTLMLTQPLGHFVTGQPIKCITTNASWILLSFQIMNVPAARIVVKPNPVDVVLPNNYTYTTIITEYPFIDGNSTITFDELIYNFSSTEQTMDTA